MSVKILDVRFDESPFCGSQVGTDGQIWIIGAFIQLFVVIAPIKWTSWKIIDRFGL
jgi:hypothetical protein